jgi:hypothetical protein
VLDLEKLDRPARGPALAELKKQFQSFEKDEERATSVAPARKGFSSSR